jgi:hypothetical protein
MWLCTSYRAAIEIRLAELVMYVELVMHLGFV